jgi:LysR family glycine cleavage system transcriptional activator
MINMRRRLPSLAALRAFESAARHLSFSRAAEELCVTHGAISHQIRGLEASLGFPLFRRLHRRVVLSEAGEALFAKVRTAFDLLEMSTEQVVTTYGRQMLVVSCIATFSMRWLIPRLHQFQAKYPDIDIRLCAPDSPLEFPRGDIDVSIRVGHGAARLCCEPILSRPRMICGTIPCCTPKAGKPPGPTGCALPVSGASTPRWDSVSRPSISCYRRRRRTLAWPLDPTRWWPMTSPRDDWWRRLASSRASCRCTCCIRNPVPATPIS